MEITKPRGVLRAVASKSNARLMSLTQNPRCPGQSPAKDRFRIPQRPLNLGGGNASSCPEAALAAASQDPLAEGASGHSTKRQAFHNPLIG